MKVTVDGAVCGGHGECVVAAPDVFDFIDDGDVVSVIEPAPAEAQRERVLDAERRCPNSAIHVSQGG
ncbi:MAG TPA: ferredoxin [Pseudonocardia sp.]|jgi:ferredoxin